MTRAETKAKRQANRAALDASFAALKPPAMKPKLLARGQSLTPNFTRRGPYKILTAEERVIVVSREKNKPSKSCC